MKSVALLIKQYCFSNKISHDTRPLNYELQKSYESSGIARFHLSSTVFCSSVDNVCNLQLFVYHFRLYQLVQVNKELKCHYNNVK